MSQFILCPRAQPLGGLGGRKLPTFEATFLFPSNKYHFLHSKLLNNENLILPQNALKLTYINIRSVGREEKGEGGKGMKDGLQHVGSPNF